MGSLIITFIFKICFKFNFWPFQKWLGEPQSTHPVAVYGPNPTSSITSGQDTFPDKTLCVQEIVSGKLNRFNSLEGAQIDKITLSQIYPTDTLNWPLFL